MAISVERLIQKALELKQEGNVGIAYTYNEPLIGYEFVFDCAKAAKQGLNKRSCNQLLYKPKAAFGHSALYRRNEYRLKELYNDFYKNLKAMPIPSSAT